ncbi:hypothetical protein ACS0TY_033919 [Phlomoides rotata]
MEKKMRDFLWEGMEGDHGNHLVAWEIVTRPKVMGVDRLLLRNKSLLGFLLFTVFPLLITTHKPIDFFLSNLDQFSLPLSWNFHFFRNFSDGETLEFGQFLECLDYVRVGGFGDDQKLWYRAIGELRLQLAIPGTILELFQANLGGSLSKKGKCITSICWRPDGKAIAVGLEDGTISLHDVENGKLLRSMKFHCVSVICLNWVEDRKKLMDGDRCNSTYEDRTARFFPPAPRVPQTPGLVQGDSSSFMDDNDDSFRELFDSSHQQLDILCSGDKDGNIYFNIFDIFPIGKVVS